MNTYQLSVLEYLTDESKPNFAERLQMLRRLIHEDVPDPLPGLPRANGDESPWVQGIRFFGPRNNTSDRPATIEDSHTRAQCWADFIVNEKKWCHEGIRQVLRDLELENRVAPSPGIRRRIVTTVAIEVTTTDPDLMVAGNSAWLVDQLGTSGAKELLYQAINLYNRADIVTVEEVRINYNNDLVRRLAEGGGSYLVEDLPPA